MHKLASLLVGALALAPTAAFAHTGIGLAADHVHGFMHPLGGLDHILAMVAAGIFAYQLGGRALWAVPVTFVLVMAVAGGLGMAGMPLPFVESGIALSVIVLGAIVALGMKAPVAIAMGIAGLFAIFHGYAHGAELPSNASGLGYAFGFMLATALLHAAGIGLGHAVGRVGESYGKSVYRVAGAVVAIAGVGLLTGAV